MKLFLFAIENGASIEARNKEGATPIMIASLHSRHAIVCELISRGASINCSDYNGVGFGDYENKNVIANQEDIEKRTMPLNQVVALIATQHAIDLGLVSEIGKKKESI